MKKKIIIIVSSILAILIIVCVIAFTSLSGSMSKKLEVYQNFNFGSVDLTSVKDGTYIGSEDGGMVKASVEVTVKDHAFAQIKILSHDCGKGKPAEVIVNDIVDKNSLEVDAISGATYSSEVIKKAVYNAIYQSK